MEIALKLIPWGLVIAASVMDWRTLRLPHALTLPAAVLAILVQGHFGPGWGESCAGAVTGFGIVKGAQVFCRRRHGREALGSGDALLMLSLGALAGPARLPWAIGMAAVMAAVAVKIRHQGQMPFGPFLTAGCLGALIFDLRMEMA